MLKPIETIPDYLARMRIKDQTKHDMELGGLRSTQEIAEYFSLTPAMARKVLQKLADQGLIEAYGRCEYSPGRPFLWAAISWDDGPGIDPDPDDGEPLPANDNDVELQVISCR